ncbi:MAG: M23 family metallopeptidase [Bacillota bacterium]
MTVIIYHGLDVFTAYGHLSKIKAYENHFVHKGQIIGMVGASGLATGPHLHLTIRIGEIPVDPYLFLDREVDWNF